jgi:cysteine desulfurase
MLNPNYLHFDNNGTTPMDPRAKAAMEKFASCSNPSRQGKDAAKERLAIEQAKNTILQYCGVSADDFIVIFTSGASESNSFILQSCCYSFHEKAKKMGKQLARPHVILSAMEHASSLECANLMQNRGHAEFTFVRPTSEGQIQLKHVQAALKKNTCLISIMYANNEIPVINEVRKIAEWALSKGIPMHSDAVQVFGKFRINMQKINGLSALSFSAHKFYGPKGCGGILLSRNLVDGYGLKGIIAGKQQGGLRGGTENVCAIAATNAALKATAKGREKKNAKLKEMRDLFLRKMDEMYNFCDYDETLEIEEKGGELMPVFLISLGPKDEKNRLMNTVLLAICKTKGKPFCNVALSKWMERKKITIGIGSTCNSSSDKASHVLEAINATPLIKRGVVRISFGDKNTKKEVSVLVETLIDGIEAQCKDLD